MSDANKIGIINEVGDLGFGFTPISKDDQEQLLKEGFKISDDDKKSEE